MNYMYMYQVYLINICFILTSIDAFRTFGLYYMIILQLLEWHKVYIKKKKQHTFIKMYLIIYFQTSVKTIDLVLLGTKWKFCVLENDKMIIQ